MWYEITDAAVYRSNVQRVQSEAMSWHMEFRVRCLYSNEHLVAANFEVFWDEWQLIGKQRDPFTDKARFFWDEDAWTRITYQAAGVLSRS